MGKGAQTAMSDRYNDELEEMVDAVGLAKVLDMLSDIAYEKAEHIRANWQDRDTACVWRKAGNCVYKSQMEVEGLMQPAS
jgi:hypothetical protein